MPSVNSLEDTIVAISTPIGEGGIGIVRMSGKDSLKIADNVFKSKNGKLPSQFKTYTTHHGYVIASERSERSNLNIEIASAPAAPRNDNVVDEVILTVMKAPKSYTKEDIVEINCHGGIVPLRKCLELILSLGARMAEPGEFTKRAFLNGRLDLVQAEAVSDVIRAKTDLSLKVAMNQLEGGLSDEIKDLREKLLNLYTHAEASIDFPDEEKEIVSESNMLNKLENIAEKIKRLIDTSETGKVLREGIATVICGRPNVGKSSLMNTLLKEKRVIVSHIPGTTRDVIEEILNIKGIPLKIADTAGIIDSRDLLAKEGVNRSRAHIKQADLVLFLLDASEELHDEDLAIMSEIEDKKTVAVINKTDLPKKLDLKQIERYLHDKKIVEVSIKEKKNIDKLEETIVDMIWQGEIISSHKELVTNARHKNALISSHDAIMKTVDSLNKNLSPEFVAISLKESIDSLGLITGQTVSEDILDRIFSEFCVGK